MENNKQNQIGSPESILAEIKARAEKALNRAKDTLKNEEYFILMTKAKEKLTQEESYAFERHVMALIQQVDWTVILDLINGTEKIVPFQQHLRQQIKEEECLGNGKL